jgi:membrane protease subunit (stomatin/prohibitin family)
LEESGLVAEKWKLLFKYSRHGTYNCGKDYVFLAQNIKKIKSDKKIEKIERRWFSKSQIIKNLNKDKFETSGVLSVVLYYLFKKI